MSRSFRSSLLCAVCCATVVLSAAGQGAWSRAAGSAYLKISYGASTAADQFTFDGRTKPYADAVDDYSFFDRSAYLYAETGLSDRTTLIVSVPFKRIVVRDAAFRYQTYGFGTAGLGARIDLGPELQLGANDAFALNLAAGLPLGYTRNYAPSAGAGQIDASAILSYGRSFYPAPAYLQFGFGYRYRSSVYALSQSVTCNEGSDLFCVADNKPSYSDELLIHAETGVTISNFLFVQALANVVWSTDAPVTGFSVTNPIPTEQRYVKVGGGLAALLPGNTSLSAQAFVTPYGQNTVRSIDIFLGIDHRFSIRKTR